ncbi:MAG: nucleoside deaminase [Ignavibacteriaceae bacterium]|nr:nucleoside deaminase [Ignavibacteriaceae bacterium]
MLTKEEIEFYFNAAFHEAEKAFEKGEVPVGSVIVKDKKIIGRGYNRTGVLHDPTAHAEIIAISAAAGTVQSDVLSDCDLFCTLEPCIMCVGAALNAHISNIYFSAHDPKFGACGSLYNLAEQKKYNHSIRLYSGYQEERSILLLKSFFNSKRLKSTTN